MSERSSDEQNPNAETGASSRPLDTPPDPPPNPTNVPDRRGPPPNPIHHPLFLPFLLVAFTLWFGYDGFLTTDAEMLEHQNFNRIMFLIMQPICFRVVPRGIKEFLEDQQAAATT